MMFSEQLVVSIVMSWWISQSDAAKILLMPMPAGSHFNTVAFAGKAMAEAGHDVWILTPQVMEEKVIIMKQLTPIVYNATLLEEYFDKLSYKIIPFLAEGNMYRFLHSMTGMIAFLNGEFAQTLVANKILLETIKDQQFDLAFTEEGFITVFYLIAYKFEIPFVTISIIPPILPWIAGITTLPSYHPLVALPYSPKMSLYQRLVNTFFTFMFAGITNIPYYIGKETLFKEVIPEKPQISINSIIQQSEMWIIMSHAVCTSYPGLTAPNYQFVGGITAQPIKPLPEDIQLFVSHADDGVILATFGSEKLFRGAIEVHIKAFLDAFAKIKQRVILQYKPTDDDTIPPNVKCMGWLPQNDILAHPKTVLFITHGGASGQSEGIANGVPMIAIGVMGEQIHNAVKLEYHNLGKSLTLATLTADKLVEVITEITTNKTYRQNVNKCAEITKSFPSANTNIVFWTEHILKYGGSHLRPQSLSMPFYQLFMLDVLAIFASVICIFCFITYLCCRCTCRILCKKVQKVKVE